MKDFKKPDNVRYWSLKTEYELQQEREKSRDQETIAKYKQRIETTFYEQVKCLNCLYPFPFVETRYEDEINHFVRDFLAKEGIYNYKWYVDYNRSALIIYENKDSKCIIL